MHVYSNFELSNIFGKTFNLKIKACNGDASGGGFVVPPGISWTQWP
jgi:hypothetical protein